jgi:hypothetical protein
MVMFDVFNEPQFPDANTWLNGGGTITGSTGKSTTIVGMQALVDAIRSTGAQQIIVIAGVEIAGSLRIHDPNIIYTEHEFHEVASGTPTSWDALWGSFKGHYPLYYGEWALLPNTLYPYQCQGATQANADQKVIDFMNYMDQNHISWTAWAFDTYHLILDYTNFTPTRLDDPNTPWVCNTPTSTAGMGTMVKQHLLSLPTPTVSITSPANGSIVPRHSTVTISVSVSDTVGVTKVEISVDGSLLCTDTTAPFSCNWKTPGQPNASYTIQAKASDTAGSTGTGTTRVQSSSH